MAKFSMYQCDTLKGVFLHCSLLLVIATKILPSVHVVDIQQVIIMLKGTLRQDVSYHINQIYADGEQDLERTLKKLLIVRQEGNRSVRLKRRKTS